MYFLLWEFYLHLLELSNGVKLYNRTQLDGLVNQNYITIEDISKIETQRMLRI